MSGSRTALFSRTQPGGLFAIQDVPQHPGDIYFVHSGTGTDAAGYGANPDAPVATLDYAMGLCTASQGDVIYVLPGHAETISTVALSPTFDKAGVTVICLGEGENRPIWTFTHVDAAFVYSSASVKFVRPLAKCDVDSLKIVHDINATDVTLVEPEIREGTAKQFLVGIDINGGGANACDRAKVIRPRITQAAVGGNAGIELGAVADGVVIEDPYIYGDWANAGIHNPGATILTNLHLKGGTVANLNTGNHAVELVSACTGMADNLHMYGDTLGTIFDPGSLKCNGCKETDAIDQAGVDSPATSAGPLGAGAIAASTFAAGAIDAAAVADGAIDAGAIAADAVAKIGANTGPGTVFVVTKTVAQAAIVGAGAALTGASSGGAILIEDVVLQNDGTACASVGGMSVVEVYTNNAAGSASFVTDAQAKIGANAVVSGATHTTANKVVLESTKVVSIKATTEDLTSAGTLTVHLICRRLAAGATVAAA